MGKEVVVISGTALSTEFKEYCKKFKTIRLRSKAPLYFKLDKTSFIMSLIINKEFGEIVIKYNYIEGDKDKTLWIESIKEIKKII